MIHLKNNCRYSGISVIPKNWKTITTCKKPWLVFYRFYDPEFLTQFPKGKLVPLKGMNIFHTADERRAFTLGLIEAAVHDIEKCDYNPISGYRKVEEIKKPQNHIIDPEMPVIEALQEALNKLKVKNKITIKSVLKFTAMAIRALHLQDTCVKDITRAHMKAVMEELRVIKGKKWTAHCYNSYRSHLMMLFEELCEWEAIQADPMIKISKEKEIKKKRLTLTIEERQLIDEKLRRMDYRFWRFVRIFHRSGSRETEIMKLKKSDVDIQNQLATYTIMKGSEYREEQRPIPNDVLHLWEQILVEAGPQQYLFAKGLKPGDIPIRPDQITRRWQKKVKIGMGINADIYSLKHLNSTETKTKVGARLAALHNQHTEAVLNSSYDTDGVERDMQILKSIRNDFAPLKKPA